MDREFAHLLDAGLTVAGVETFLDERDIQVGDSIIRKVYDAISAATDLVYIISKNSARSRWVAEELAAAKVRQRTDEGFRIVPILIDETPPPIALSDLRYADMRRWRDAVSHREAMLELLTALGVQPILIGHEHVEWWARNREKLLELWRGVREIYVLADNCIGYWQFFDGPGRDRWVWKIARELGLVRVLKNLQELLASSPESDDRFARLRAAAEEAHAAYITREEQSGFDKWDSKHIYRLREGLGSLDRMLENLETEVTTSILSVASSRTKIEVAEESRPKAGWSTRTGTSEDDRPVIQGGGS